MDVHYCHSYHNVSLDLTIGWITNQRWKNYSLLGDKTMQNNTQLQVFHIFLDKPHVWNVWTYNSVVLLWTNTSVFLTSEVQTSFFFFVWDVNVSLSATRHLKKDMHSWHLQLQFGINYDQSYPSHIFDLNFFVCSCYIKKTDWRPEKNIIYMHENDHFKNRLQWIQFH